MEMQIFTFQQSDKNEPMPRVCAQYLTPGGIALLFVPAMSIEVLGHIRDALYTDLARMESERAMLKAMEAPRGLQ